MPKETASRSGMFGRAPRKALCVKKPTKKVASKAKVQKKDGPAALEVARSPEHVSASPTPPTPSSPRSPRSPRSPTYDREPWWDPVISLTRRMDAVTASMKELTDRVKELEDERDKRLADGCVFGKQV